MIADCTAIILAGGESSRMGRDKANLRLGAQTLLQEVAAILQPLFAEIMVSVRSHRHDIGLRQVSDDPAHHGPLGGLLAGMEAADTPWVFLVACDMPFIIPAVIHHLARLRDGHQAVVPRVHGHPQPMFAFYRRDGSVTVREILQDAAAKHSLRGLLQRLDTRYVEQVALQEADPQLQSFFDLDTPQDFAAAQRRYKEA